MANTGKQTPDERSGKRANNSRIPRKTPWSLAEVRRMPQHNIVATLHGLGIPITMDEFREQAKQFCSAEDLSDRWFEAYHVTATGWDEDFPWYAAWVLWERLDGDTIPYETVSELMGEEFSFAGEEDDLVGVIELGDDDQADFDIDDEDFDEHGIDEDEDEFDYEDGDEGEHEDEDEDEDLFRALSLSFPSGDVSECWMQLRAWDYIKALFSGKVTSVEEAMEICSPASSLKEWCADLADRLDIEGSIHPVLTRERLRFAREVCGLFPESEEEFIQLMRSAEAGALFELGRGEEGDEVFRTIVQQWPDWTWGYIYWGDAYADKASVHLEHAARAREIYGAALRFANEHDAQVIRERLEDLDEAEDS